MTAIYQVPVKLFDSVLTLLTFAVHEHVQENGKCGLPLKADSGWEDAYELMEQMEKVRDA